MNEAGILSKGVAIYQNESSLNVRGSLSSRHAYRF